MSVSRDSLGCYYSQGYHYSLYEHISMFTSTNSIVAITIQLIYPASFSARQILRLDLDLIQTMMTVKKLPNH